MKPSNFIIKLLVLFYLSVFSAVQAQWSFLIYADPASEITEAALKNLNELVQSYSSPEVQIYVQLRVFVSQNASKSYAWRYKVHDNCLQFVEAVQMAEDFYIDVTSAMQWAYSQADETTNYYGLLFSGHGCGILEPKSVSTGCQLDIEYDDAQCLTCNRQFLHIPKRSILLNDVTDKAIDNKTMLEIMNFGTALIDRKFDFVGFDLCLGSMIEHAYQLAPYVYYLVGYQYCASVEGFDYSALGQKLQDLDCSPKALSSYIIQAHEKYSMQYARNNNHALSAVDCSAAVDVVELLDNFVSFCIYLINQYPEIAAEMIAARKDCYHACFVPMYTDLYQVITRIAENISSFLTNHEQFELQKLVYDVQNNIDVLVLKKFTSEQLSYLHGVNIYFPYSHIDSSYYRVPFAQNSMWLNFLKMVID